MINAPASVTGLTAVSPTLIAALEHVPTAAFVVGANGKVVHANAIGQRRIAAEGDLLVARLARAVRRTEADLEVHAAVGSDEYLVVEKPTDRIRAVAAEAATRWGLTARQREVLSCLLQGHSNLRISLVLEISERTVEVHVTAIFDRSRCCSRAELIATALFAA